MSKYSRQKRIRAKIFGTGSRPRIAVFKSNTNIYLQAIDDQKKITIASSSTLKDSDKFIEILTEKLKNMKIKKVVFDRRGYLYHGKIKFIADKLRAQGLEF